MPVSLTALWWLGAVALGLRSYVLPRPPEVVRAFPDVWRALPRDGMATAFEVTGGVVIGGGLGLLLALPLALLPLARQAAAPYVAAAAAVPKIVFAPFLVALFGVGLAPKVVLASLLAFFPMNIAATSALQHVDDAVDAFSRSIGLRGWRHVWHVRLPWAVPGLLVGFRLAIPAATIGAVVGEFITSSRGIGHFIVTQIGELNTAAAFAAALLLLLVGVVVQAGLNLAERRWSWAYRGTSEP